MKVKLIRGAHWRSDSPAITVSSIDVGTKLNQKLHYVSVAGTDSIVQCCDSLVVRHTGVSHLHKQISATWQIHSSIPFFTQILIILQHSAWISILKALALQGSISQNRNLHHRWLSGQDQIHPPERNPEAGPEDWTGHSSCAPGGQSQVFAKLTVYSVRQSRKSITRICIFCLVNSNYLCYIFGPI